MRLAPRLSDDRRFSWQVDLRLVIVAFVVLFGILAAVAYNRRATDPASTGSAAERLQPVTTPPPASGVVRRTVYVPIYSSLYLGRDIKNDMVQLTSTLSVRNVSPRFPVVIESVRYYDSHGRLSERSSDEAGRARGARERRIRRERGRHGRRAWCKLSGEVVRPVGRGRALDRSCHVGTECERRDFVYERRTRDHERAAVAHTRRTTLWHPPPFILRSSCLPSSHCRSSVGWEAGGRRAQFGRAGSSGSHRLLCLRVGPRQPERRFFGFRTMGTRTESVAVVPVRRPEHAVRDPDRRRRNTDCRVRARNTSSTIRRRAGSMLRSSLSWARCWVSSSATT